MQPENRLPVVVIKQDHGIALGISEEYPIQVNNVTDDGLDQFVPLNLLFSSGGFKGYWLGCVLWSNDFRGRLIDDSVPGQGTFESGVDPIIDELPEGLAD